ncbi:MULTISPECIES: hypothetical protein [unclassified Stenotrophomonas]|uniref:XOO1806 family protein n=1 Tax=unclassified Stenotrophomonas TaxID=196198 RepID=UPI0021186831|nr:MULTISPECIES: hypothetical protein [unclassified Stenotrophomonas]
MRSLLRLPLALVIALAAITGAHAQNKPRQDSTVLPIWNKGSGKVEALLYLEPTGEQAVGARWHFGRSSLDAAFGLSSGDSLGLLCNSSRGTSISGLASHCMLASLGDDEDSSLSRRVSGTAAFNRPGGRLGITAGSGRDTLPAWLAGPNKSPALRAEQNDLTVFGQKNIGREGFVSIGGTYAKARLVPLSDASPALVDRWDSKSLTIGAGYGNFSGNIIGRVVDVPGQPGKWEGLGVGLTWRTPWSGQLTVGAENVITRGKNPFAPRNESTDEGTVPYVRYEQDL